MEHSKKFFEASSVRVQARGSGNNIVDTGAVTTVDSIYLSYYLMGDCVVKTNTNLSFLVNSAQALSCKCAGCGENGLKNKVAGISISSDSSYNNVPANQSLNDLFQFYNGAGTLPFDSLVSILNRPYGNYYGFDIFTAIKPNNNNGHVFKLTIRFADGQTLFIDTRRIFWM